MLRDVVYDYLWTQIREKQFKPGEFVNLNLISQKLGVSRTPLREALSAYFDSVNETVTGEVRLKLYKGNIIPAGSTSPYSLYNESIASFTTGELYNHKDADGFINLFGLPLKVRAMMKQANENK